MFLKNATRRTKELGSTRASHVPTGALGRQCVRRTAPPRVPRAMSCAQLAFIGDDQRSGNPVVRLATPLTGTLIGADKR